MKNLILITTLFLFLGCGTQEKSHSSNQSTLEERPKEVKVDSTRAEEQDILRELGFEFNGDKITIDMNKTSSFIQKMESQMQRKANEIEQKIEHSELNLTQGLGIEVDGDRVAIDLNKTKDMLQQINILMKDILLDVNRSVH